jgi:hypothetical protein
MRVRKGWKADIHCKRCTLSYNTVTFDTEEKAIEKAVAVWNTRKPLEEKIERLEIMADEANDKIIKSDTPQYYDGVEDGLHAAVEMLKDCIKN